MKRYDFLESRRVILSNVRKYSIAHSNLFYHLISKFKVADLGDIALCSKERRIV